MVLSEDKEYTDLLKSVVSNLFFTALESYAHKNDIIIEYDHDVKNVIKAERKKLDKLYSLLIPLIDELSNSTLVIDRDFLKPVLAELTAPTKKKSNKAKKNSRVAFAIDLLNKYEEALDVSLKNGEKVYLEVLAEYFVKEKWIDFTGGKSSLRQRLHLLLNKYGSEISILLQEDKFSNSWLHCRTNKSILTILSKY